MHKRRKPVRKGIKARKWKQKRIAYLCGLFLAVVLVLYGISYVALYRYVHKVAANTIRDNVFIGEIDVSGMTSKEAKKAVKAKLTEYGSIPVTLKVGDNTIEVLLSELGLDMENSDKLVKDAVSYGKTGGVWKRFVAIQKLKKTKKEWKPEFVLDEDMALAVMVEKVMPLGQAAQDATITRENGAFVITDEQDGHEVDAEEGIKDVTEFLNKSWDYKTGQIEMPLATTTPSVKRADLETIQDELGSYSTAAGYGDRVTNLRRGAELLNGIVIMPGQEISVEQRTLPYSEENGYVDGGAYENGQVVQSIAGGICQVSSTLYNAVLYAELDVTERSPHSIIVSYVDPSRDAAIAEGVKDFKFVNNYDTPIYIEGYINGNNKLYFAIYGKDTREEGHSVEYESETLENTDYTKVYVEDTENSIGNIENNNIGINGKTARLWKIVYENGQEVSRDVINNSTYKATEMKVKIGTASDNPQASELVRSAISSQNEDTIKAAIAQAQALDSTTGE